MHVCWQSENLGQAIDLAPDCWTNGARRRLKDSAPAALRRVESH